MTRSEARRSKLRPGYFIQCLNTGLELWLGDWDERSPDDGATTSDPDEAKHFTSAAEAASITRLLCLKTPFKWVVVAESNQFADTSNMNRACASDLACACVGDLTCPDCGSGRTAPFGDMVRCFNCDNSWSRSEALTPDDLLQRMAKAFDLKVDRNLTPQQARMAWEEALATVSEDDLADDTYALDFSRRERAVVAHQQAKFDGEDN